MSQEWRNRDPIEDRMLSISDPDATVNRVQEINEEIERTRQNLDDESIEIIRSFMELVAKAHETRKKAERVESEIQSEI